MNHVKFNYLLHLNGRSLNRQQQRDNFPWITLIWFLGVWDGLNIIWVLFTFLFLSSILSDLSTLERFGIHSLRIKTVSMDYFQWNWKWSSFLGALLADVPRGLMCTISASVMLLPFTCAHGLKNSLAFTLGKRLLANRKVWGLKKPASFEIHLFMPPSFIVYSLCFISTCYTNARPVSKFF